MAPDADKLRNRKTGARDDKEDDGATHGRLSTVKGLRPNEVAIDGVIFDISNFDHPGGESIRIFGGNDVTATYKMIHPYHTSAHLEKMTRVGKLTDYVTE
jgi:acyl-lipid (7-3)-desaturase (Delta-4 desaturase)